MHGRQRCAESFSVLWAELVQLLTRNYSARRFRGICSSLLFFASFSNAHLFSSPVAEPLSWRDTVDLPFGQDAPRHRSELVKYGTRHQFFLEQRINFSKNDTTVAFVALQETPKGRRGAYPDFTVPSRQQRECCWALLDCILHLETHGHVSDC